MNKFLTPALLSALSLSSTLLCTPAFAKNCKGIELYRPGMTPTPSQLQEALDFDGGGTYPLPRIEVLPACEFNRRYGASNYGVYRWVENKIYLSDTYDIGHMGMAYLVHEVTHYIQYERIEFIIPATPADTQKRAKEVEAEYKAYLANPRKNPINISTSGWQRDPEECEAYRNQVRYANVKGWINMVRGYERSVNLSCGTP